MPVSFSWAFAASITAASTRPSTFTAGPRLRPGTFFAASLPEVVAGLMVPSGISQSAATVLHTARELLRHSCFCYEFSTVALLHTLVAMEFVLRAKVPDSGTRPLDALIKRGKESGLLTGRQSEFLHEGR